MDAGWESVVSSQESLVGREWKSKWKWKFEV